MADRKKTPDVLGAVLGDTPASAEPLIPTPAEATDTPAKTPKKERSKTARRKVEPRVFPPRQWEYRTVVFYNYRGWKPRYIDDVELAGWKDLPNMPAYINQMGEEGWELAGASDVGRNELLTFFKRPKKSG